MFQVFGGFLLLVFAMMVESTIGYHGYLGEVALGNSDRWDMMLWRNFHMETIHTIAACMMVTGVVMGLLSMNGGVKRTRRNITILALLALLSIVLTVPAWELARSSYGGYPFAMRASSLLGRDIPVQYPIIGESSFPDLLYRVLLMFLGGAPEPLFPFISISFIGCIIGICMCKGEGSFRKPRTMMAIGIGSAMIGLVGTALVLLSGAESYSLLLDRTYELPGLYPNLWLWWFLLIAGFEVFVTVLIIRLVEYRGIGESVGRGTLWIRRYGFVAFSVYAFQTIDFIPRLLITAIPGIGDAYPYPSKVSPLLAIALIPMTVLLWEVVLRAWERIGFTGGLEWCMAKLTEGIFSDRRADVAKRKPWWSVARLDIKGYLKDPQWIDIRGSDDIDHGRKEDSKLSLYLSLGGILFVPLSFLSFFLARSAMRTEGKNRCNRTALWLSVVWIVAFALILIALSQVHLNF